MKKKQNYKDRKIIMQKSYNQDHAIICHTVINNKLDLLVLSISRSNKKFVTTST